jgi:hypothetical protein
VPFLFNNPHGFQFCGATIALRCSGTLETIPGSAT